MFPMFDKTGDIAIWIGILVFSSAFHEMAHAWVAYRCGDDTAKSMGRITMNPLYHISLFDSIILPAFLYFASQGSFIFGGAKPVIIVPDRMRNPERDMALSSAAGPISNLIIVLVTVFLLLLTKPLFFGQDWRVAYLNPWFRLMLNVILLNLVLTFFNLIPIPPLDGSRILRYFIPGLREMYNQLDQIGIAILLGILLVFPGTLDFIIHLIRFCFQAIAYLYRAMPA